VSGDAEQPRPGVAGCARRLVKAAPSDKEDLSSNVLSMGRVHATLSEPQHIFVGVREEPTELFLAMALHGAHTPTCPAPRQVCHRKRAHQALALVADAAGTVARPVGRFGCRAGAAASTRGDLPREFAAAFMLIYGPVLVPVWSGS